MAKIAGLLKIWVYGWAEEGEIKPLGKARGEKKTLAALLRTLEEKGYKGGRVKIDHADNFDSAAEFHDLIRKKHPEARVDMGTCRALCSFYAEAGGLIFYFSTSRLHLVVRLDPALVQSLLEVSQDIVAIDVLFLDAFVKNVIQLS